MAFLSYKEIVELIEKVSERGLSLLEVESAGMKLRIEGRRSEIAAPAAAPAERQATAAALPSPSPGVAAGGALPPAGAAAPEEESDTGLHIITSPIVGTFYRSPNPESDVFVNVGDRVSKGAVLCIIEAMKLMNEIEADTEGVLMRIYPQNGQPVEYGEKLFAIKV